jgi:class 3 adenylate cyclase
MDAPTIRYAKTSDGVSIAYWSLGRGPALVYIPPMPGHVLVEWESAVFGVMYRSLAERYQLIRLDYRNNGLSQRVPGTAPIESAVLDIEAVVDALGLGRIALWALGLGGHSAIMFAVQRPERVDALILSECFTSFGEIAGVGQVQALVSLAERDYETFTETMGNVFFGWYAQEPAREFAALLRASVTQEQLLQGLTQFVASDVSDLLPSVRARTLVLHHRGAELVPQQAATKLASAIAGARLVLLEGDTVAGPQGDPLEFAIIDEFLLGADAPARPTPAQNPQGTAIILFADIADSTALTERLGDAAFREKARELDAALRNAIAANGGTAIEGKLLGDGVLATFGAAREAIACAQACHELAGSRATGQGPRENYEPLLLHVGIHAGDVIRESNNVYGGAVNIAARVAGEAAAGETLVSGTVRELARTSAGVSFEDRGERALKGVGEPVRVWAVGPSESR